MASAGRAWRHRFAHNWYMGSQGRQGWRQHKPATGRGFRPLGELESDRSGVLIAARSEVSGALVDIRVLAPALTADRASMSRLGRDMDVLREVRHTNLVSVMNFDKRVGAVVYESVPGSTLSQVLRGQGSLELAASLVLLDDCAAGLAALHNDGVLHRNVTPDAVVIETTGAVLLRDAGLWVHEHANGNGSLPDQHAYLAPEVRGGAEYTPAADLYAATAVFVESIGGRASKTGVRADLRSLVSAGMAADPSARSANITAFRHELDDYARATVGEAWRREGRALLTAAASAQATRTIRLSPSSEDGNDGGGAAKATVALLQSEPPVDRGWLLALAAIAGIALLGALFAARLSGSQGPSLGGLAPAPVILPGFTAPTPGFSGIAGFGPGASPAPGSPSSASGPAAPGVLPTTPGANPTGNPRPTPPPNPALSSQTVTITSAMPSGATYGGSYTASASGGASGNPVVFSAGSSAGCTKSGSSTFAFTGVGTCTIYASQAGNSHYNPGQTSRSFTVGQASQVIVYGPYPSSPIFGGGFTVTASAAGGLVTFSLDPSSTACTLGSGAVAFTGVGPCIIDANQGGGADYRAATMHQIQLDVAQAPQSIATPFNFSPAISCPCIGQSYTVSASGGGSGNPVTFTLVSGIGVCSISGNTITAILPGDCTIQANQAGNANYSDAPPVQQTITFS
jgi:serine/threonine protein kinase